MLNAGCSLVFIFPRIKLNFAGQNRIRTGASGNVEGGTGTGSDFEWEMATRRHPHTGYRLQLDEPSPDKNIPHSHKAPASILSLLYYFPFGSKRGSTLKFKVRSPQSRKLKLVFLLFFFG